MLGVKCHSWARPAKLFIPLSKAWMRLIAMLKSAIEVCQRVDSALQGQGDVGVACELLRSLLVVLAARDCHRDVWSEASACQLLGEAAYLLAMRLLQQGAATQVDGLLSTLGFRHRLATAAFQLPAQPSALAVPSALQTQDMHQQQQLGVQDQEHKGQQHHQNGQGQKLPGPGLAPAPGLECSSPHPDQLPLQPNAATAPAHALLATGAAAARPPAPPPLVLEAALEPALLAALQRGFGPTAAYWKEHGYWGGSSGFFSYVYPFSDQPRHPIETAIVQLHQRLLAAAGQQNEAAAGPAGGAGAAAQAVAEAELRGSASEAAELAARVRRATHAEWWVHCRDPSAPHQLHFDVDETRLRRGRGSYALRHPLLGSLLFLSGHPCHGPTLVLDQAPGDSRLAAGGWLVGAATGRYTAFRGDLLHGVMPGAAPELGSKELGSQALPPRTTLMVAWWEFDSEQQLRLAAQQQQQQQEVGQQQCQQQQQQQQQQAGSGLAPSRAVADPGLFAEGPAGSTMPAEGRESDQGGSKGAASKGGSSRPAPATTALTAAAAATEPMQLPPWRQQTSGAHQHLAWPAEFVEGGPEAAAYSADGHSGSLTQGAASSNVFEGCPAMWRLQPAWVRVGSEGPEGSGGGTAAGGSGHSTAGHERWEEEEEESREEEREVEGLSSCSERAAVGEQQQQQQQQQRAAKRARREGTAGDPGLVSKGRAQLPLLYPPLRFFLFDEGDIHTAYTPAGYA